MRKLLTDKPTDNLNGMTFEQLLILIAYECGEYAIEDFLKDRYNFPILHDDFIKEREDK